MSLFRKPNPIADATEEHHITLPGLDIAFNQATKTVFLIDQSGAANTVALSHLEEWYKRRGWFLHWISVEPPPPSPAETEPPAKDRV